MESTTFGNISLREFHERSLRTLKKADLDAMTQLSRILQKGAFEILWDRFHGVDANLVSYRNVGHATQFIVPDGAVMHRLIHRLRNHPFTGSIKAARDSGDDYRFICIAQAGAIYLLLENAAMDSKQTQVQVYDTEAEGFVPHHTSLITFLMKEEVSLKVQEGQPA